MKYSLLIAITLLLSFPSSAQDSLRVSVLANVKNDAIQLRWAVNTPLAWKQSNRNGFRVERYTVVRNDVILAQPERIVLTPQPLKPQPLDDWEALATKNNYAAVIAQALYGEDFELSGDDAKGVSKFIALAQELEQRYTIAMYAADLCYPAALLAGWGYEDKSVQPGERYLYRVIPVLPEKSVKIETGSVYTSLAEKQTLPQPQELTAVFGDKSVMLTWNYGVLDHVYNAYFVERSKDGKSFTRLSELPLTNMNSRDGKPSDRMFYIDSLSDNSNTQYYRIAGVTAFSEEGPVSEVVSGKGKNKLIYVPHIQRAIPDNTGGVTIAWEFDEGGDQFLESFELHRGDRDKGPFTPVLTGIAPGQRSIIYNTLQPSNYFIIAAKPKEGGEPTFSFPVLVQPLDTVPPLIPQGLTGSVDSLGVVRLSWQANGDSDILGYRIFRAQTKEEELIPLNDVAVRENHFTDTIEVRNLNSMVYYAVTAVDQRYNQSEKSPVTVIQKPDIVPPSPPVIVDYKVTAQGVWLEWVTGQEENLASLKLYRLDKETGENELIKTFTDLAVMQFTDSTAATGGHFGYTVTAFTTRGLASPPSPVVTVKAFAGTGSVGKITDFTAKVNKKSKQIELSWKHDVREIKEFQLYKGEVGKPVSLWKVLKGYEAGIQDKDIEAGTRYEYIIRAVLEGGKTGIATKVTSDKN